jgi:capsular exopolysaccharide synthesis family protein
MSKIYDALRKSAGEPVPADEPPPPGRRPASRVPIETSTGLPREFTGPAAEFDADETPLSYTFARELAHLRASVEQALPDLAHRTILLAGSVPGEGTSTVAARFAQFLGSDTRMHIALIDADLRNADPRPVEAVAAGEGLASVLAGHLAPANAFRASEMRGLDVLPSEGVASDPYALCSAEHLDPFLNYLRGQYHYAILDVAPVLSAPETAVLAGEVDGVVLVVRAGKTKREVIHQSIHRLQKYNARILGVVMNRQHYVIPEFIYRRL